MSVRVTVDTNVYVSGLNFEGPPAALIRLASEGVIRLAITEAILDEVGEVLARKFDWNQTGVLRARALLSSVAERVRPVVTLDAVPGDEDDNRILECAQSAHSQFIVTGDRDLLRLRQYDGIPIVTVREFLARLAERDGC